MILKFRKYIKDDEAFNVAVAFIFGYRSQIDQNTISAFTSTGTIHVLSVSGLHVSLVFVLLNMLLFWMDRFRYGKFIKSIFILLAIWSYVILTGMSPPILRAEIMITFFVFSILINRKQIPLNTLAASALFILLFDPNYLFDVGFQLSYLAILGIILLYPILRNYYLTPNKWANYVLEYVYISIAAQLFTMPLTLYYFGQFPNYFLVANLFIALPSTLVMYAGIILTLFNFEWLNQLSALLVEWGLVFMMQGLKSIEGLPFALIQGIEWNYGQVIILIVGITALIMALNARISKAFLITISSFLILSLLNSFVSFQKSSYQALKFYNIRSEVDIAAIKGNHVVLYSTLDSLKHSTLQYSVLPDLRNYTNENSITLEVLNSDERTNRILEIGNHQVLILENKLDSLPNLNLDYILWRENNYNEPQHILDRYPNARIIIDGSNSDKTIERLKSAIGSNSARFYILKNNFAYVWEGE